MVESRFYNVRGTRFEARFLRKGELFPDTEAIVPRQGVWARPESAGWDGAFFVGTSWQFVQMNVDVVYFPDQQ